MEDSATSNTAASDGDGSRSRGRPHADPRLSTDEGESDGGSDDEGIIGSRAVDFKGVDFDGAAVDGPPRLEACVEQALPPNDDSDSPTHGLARDPAVGALVNLERSMAFPDAFPQPRAPSSEGAAADASSRPSLPPNLTRLFELLTDGQYIQILTDKGAHDLLAKVVVASPAATGTGSSTAPTSSTATTMASVQDAVVRYCCEPHESVEDGAAANASSPVLTRMIEAEVVGIASLCLFLQANYTGPALDDDDLDDPSTARVDPHPCFRDALSWTESEGSRRSGTTNDESKETDNGREKLTSTKRSTSYQNAVLSELAVEGNWPCQVCSFPYSLLLARAIFAALTGPVLRTTESEPVSKVDDGRAQRTECRETFRSLSRLLVAAPLWAARSAVAHERLLQAREPTETLWNQVSELYEESLTRFQSELGPRDRNEWAARVALEYGLAQHHFDRPGMGRKCFADAQMFNGLAVHVTGAPGRRTKYQKFATAQLLVKAESASAAAASTPAESPSAVAEPDAAAPEETDPSNGGNVVRDQRIEHSEDGILLERIKFEDDKENEVSSLSVLDQSILLALCLDVKNSNPSDGLTAEEMGGYLATVLDHYDDWMVYSTALLERAWLEFERSHARERAILQMQALVDQHTQRLTLTQSTRQSIEESAPVQDRLQRLHYIVYPPRWTMISDLADRYAALGIVSTAAELFAEVEMWDEVVSCYRRAGKLATAERIVRERLEVAETPRMWSALGDVTSDPQYYLRAIELSKGRFAEAHVSLGAYYFEKGDLSNALVQYESAVKVRPRLTHVWFRLGTVAMQLDQWDTALRAFSEVVQQEPEESEAWANVAAIHMHNKHPHQAYPALTESLKHNRDNWRVWVSKLYACLDLEKFDEAVQACNVILDLKAASDRIPPLEPRCVRGIVGGSIQRLKETQGDTAAVESSRRTLSRVHQLLTRMSTSSDAEPWVHETMAYLHEQVGQDERVMEDLMKEYRALQGVAGWEKDDSMIRNMCRVVSHVVELHLHLHDGSREGLTKAKWLARGVVTKVRASRAGDATDLPGEVQSLEKLLSTVEEKLRPPSA